MRSCDKLKTLSFYYHNTYGHQTFQDGGIQSGDPIHKLLETSKYWVDVQWGQSYLMGRRCLFSLRWRPF